MTGSADDYFLLRPPYFPFKRSLRKYLSGSVWAVSVPFALIGYGLLWVADGLWNLSDKIKVGETR